MSGKLFVNGLILMTYRRTDYIITLCGGTNVKCDHYEDCHNCADYAFNDVFGKDIWLCEKCAISYFSLYPMKHYECEHCGKPIECTNRCENHLYCSMKCALEVDREK